MADAPTFHAGASPDGQDLSWSQVWQLPTLLLGMGLLILGVYMALPGREVSDFHGALADVELLLEKDQLDEAEQKLDEQIKPRINEATVEDLGYFWRLYGDLVYLKLYKTGVVGQHGVESAIPIYKKILEYYRNAQDKGYELTGAPLRRFVRTLVALGQDEQALAILDRMRGAEASQRYLILRDMIERKRADSAKVDQAFLDAIEPLMQRFRKDVESITDPAIARIQTAWVDGLQASLMIDAGTPELAIDFLLRRIQRLAAKGGDRDLAPLYIRLAQAYEAIGDNRTAEQRYLHAQSLLDATDDMNAEILVGLGRLALAQTTGQEVEEALELFRQAEENYPNSPAHIQALLGRADCEARLGDHGAAIHYFDLAARELVSRTRAWDPRRAEAVVVLNTHFERSVDVNEYERAKDYLDVLALIEGKEPSAKLLLNLAVTCEKIGDQRLAAASQAIETTAGQRPMSPEARRLANQQAAEYYAKAARYYEQHAAKVTIDDNEAHGDSLWQSALNYDRAQLWSDAIRVYEQFITTRNGDPRRLRAIRNLGLAYLADRQYAPALAQFQRLVDEHPRSPETYASLVPMAKCQEAMGDLELAAQTLSRVLEDHQTITPDSGEYREALIALGKLYHRMGKDDPDKYARAIELLSEAVQRYGQDEEGPVLRYLLADALRQSVPALDEQIAVTQSQSIQLTLQQERNDRLEQAQMLYNQAINGFEALRNTLGELDAIEQVYLRNAYFYQADCAYDRGVYEQAIQLYSTAANNYANDPASLIARIQIVNAYCELGRFQDARVANDMARSQLERIPDSAFEDENLPMKRAHWENWLRWTSERDLFGRQASADGVGG